MFEDSSGSGLTQVVTGSGMRDLIKKIEDLPVIPPVGVKALTLSLRDDADLENLGRIIESDPVLTASILRLVNNARTGLMEKVATVRQAMALAGLNQVRCALLGVMFRDHLSANSQEINKDASQLWAHSLLAAVIARSASRVTYPHLQEAAFVAALLHDIGKAVIMEVFPDSHLSIEQERKKRDISWMEAEQEILDTNHCLVGMTLARQWNLPGFIIDCIWFHHHFEASDVPTGNKRLLSLVMAANRLAHDIFCDCPSGNGYFSSGARTLSQAGLKDQDIERLMDEATKEYSEKAAFFNLEDDMSLVFQGVVQKANKKLSNMGLELESKNRCLARSNQLLDMAGNLSLRLNPVLDRQTLFDEVAGLFSEFQPIKAGCFYVMEPEPRELEGVAWMEGGRKRRLLCFLNKEGQPVWEHDDQRIPADLKKILSSYRSRCGFKGSQSYNAQPPFHVFSFRTKEGMFGELCVFPGQDFQDIHEQQGKVFFQMSQILGSTLERIALYEQLERRSEELSQAVWKNRQMNLQLMQTERLAAVGQLAAGAAHEINNPLAIISARAQLLQLKEKDEKRKKELALISDQIDRISKILSNLMDFARPTPPTLQDTHVHQVLDRVLELTESGFKKHGIKVAKNYEQEVGHLKADSGQLEQVFLNLLINAQHAMEKKGGVLKIKTSLSSDRKNVIISVQDQGEGISRDNLKKIFDPFFTTKEEGKGTGLGLSTSYGIINSHFGSIDIFSEQGKGTTVNIELPVNIADLRPAFSGDRVAGPGANEQMRPRVLVVDDEEHIREVLKEALEDRDMIVETADNGQKGLEKLLSRRFDLLLLDIKMPMRDGLSLLREIRKADERLPVIVITGMASHEEMSEALGHGNCKCMRKPFHIKTLMAQINDSLTGQG
ncbi:HDOD domain-containing protein [Desulfonatronovibrio hydrogenovorans]|uniref:HDOD domain-containing protein n=1 Tax=Desulfonatronovibrio hydrogenovorans TaxID=53245 RepID=UPI0004906161|nr:HDOD domain-containing protein [Desulfonatronovibrio hydrogenovorans]